MSDADCTPGREPRSVAACLLLLLLLLLLLPFYGHFTLEDNLR